MHGGCDQIEKKAEEGTTKVNPFDTKSLLLARHAQHVVLIHFPIALFIASNNWVGSLDKNDSLQKHPLSEGEVNSTPSTFI